jgi:hypothetical protein
MRFACTWLLIACSSDTTDDDGNGDGNGTDTDTDTPPPTADVTVDIVAAAGGTVVLGDATLEVPPGALAADTTITVSALAAASLPEADTISGDGYDFGPDGLQFLIPATLAIDLGAPAATDEVYVVSQLDATAGSWVDLVTTTVGTVASAPVEHFSTLAARFLSEDPGDGSCPFTPCGGDVLGSYTLGGRCDPFPIHPYDDDCPTATAQALFDFEDSVLNFHATGYYDTFTIETVTTTVVLPTECVASMALANCGDADADGFACTGEVPAPCTCTNVVGPATSYETGIWDSDGYGVTLDDLMDPAPPVTYDYCVVGGVLELQDPDGVISTYSM